MQEGGAMPKTTFIVLAKSYKPGGRCIAGKVASFESAKKLRIGSWFRPVPEDGIGAIAESSLVYSDGRHLRVLDVVELTTLDKVKVPGQPENQRYDTAVSWKYLGKFKASHVRNLVDSPDNIWLEDDQPTNRISSHYAENNEITNSLYLIKPSRLMVTLENTFNEYKGCFKKKISASFEYNGQKYENLSITCPSTRLILKNQYPHEGDEPIALALRKGDDYYLCVSLTPEFGTGNYHYKLVATIFDFDGYLQGNYAA